MTVEEQKLEFEKLCARAKRAGLLKAHYPAEGIAVVAIPPAPVAPPAESAHQPSPQNH